MLRWLPAAAWAALIFTFSSLSEPPGASSSELRSNLAHLTEYLVLAFLLVSAARATWPGSPLRVLATAAWLACVTYAFSDEFHQSFVPGRDSSLLDVGFDSLGAALGVLVGTRRKAARE